jgi:hypothetical protein
MAHPEQFMRSEVGIELHNDVEEGILLGTAHRISPVERRDGDDTVQGVNGVAK